MCPNSLLALFLLAAVPGLGQTAASAGPGLPKDPRAVFAAAAPFYNFTDAALKPWHLKATYQLYDEKGKHSEQGTYEYWWVTSKEHRSTWTRSGNVHTDWHTEDGKYAYYDTIGEPLNLFEYSLQAALLAPLPSSTGLDPEKFRLEDEGVALDGKGGPCFTIVPRMKQDGPNGKPEQGPFPTYCFEPQKPVLRTVYSFERVTTEFTNIVQTQGKYLAREVNILEGKRRLLSATVDALEEISPSDPALTPSPTAARTYLGLPESAKVRNFQINEDIAKGMLVKKLTPIYPMEAKKARIQGDVVLKAFIGTDGNIHDLRVVSAPSASLAASSFWSVSQWVYKPYLLDGQPLAVETTININFALGK